MTEPREPHVNEREPVASAQGNAPVVPEAAQPETAESTGEEPTIGTGTSIALGCVAATVLLVILGLIFLIVVMVLS